MRKNIIVIFTVIVSFFVGFSLLYFVYNLKPTTEITQLINENNLIETSINSSIEKVFDATVVVEVYRNNTLIGTGSGFVYKQDDNKAYILTNNHVIERATSVRVIFSNDTLVIADVLGKDAYADIAVLSVAKDKILKVAPLGDSEKLKIGDVVFTIGSPSGYDYSGSVSKGIVSAKNRLISIETSVGQEWMMKVIQTDASLNPGNSGGPLVNVNGEVVGITSLKLGNEDKIEGVGFAILITDVMKYINKLETGGIIKRPTIDLKFVSLTDSAIINQLGITSNGEVTTGVMVTEDSLTITDIKKGNIVIAIDNVEISNADYFKYLISRYDIGNKVSIRYYDGKAIKTTTVTLIENK